MGQTKCESINLVVSRVEKKKKMMKVSGWANESGQETTAFRGGRVPLGTPCSLQGKGSTYLIMASRFLALVLMKTVVELTNIKSTKRNSRSFLGYSKI